MNLQSHLAPQEGEFHKGNGLSPSYSNDLLHDISSSMESRTTPHLRSDSNKDLLHENSSVWPETFHGLYEQQSQVGPSNNVFAGLSPTSPRGSSFISEAQGFPRPSSAQGLGMQERDYPVHAPSRTPPMSIDTRVNGSFPSFNGPMHQPAGFGPNGTMDARYS